MRLVPAGRMKLLAFLFLLPIAVFAADKQPNAEGIDGTLAAVG